MSFPRYERYKDSGVEWLGKVPEHWQVRRLRYSARLVTEKATQQTNPLALENIESWTGRLLPSETKFEGDGTRFRIGDLLFGKLRPYLAKAYLAESEGEAVGDFHVMRPSPFISGRFLFHQLINRDSIALLDGSTFGSKMPRVGWDFMANMVLATPPIAEQVRVADFIAQETAKIDALIEEQRRLIELLKEKRQAVISRTITQGLDLQSPMKFSGADWLGSVPLHWIVQRAGHLFIERDERSESGEEEMLTVSHLTGVTPRSEKTVNMFEAETTEGYKRVYPGDLVINTLWAWMGAMGVSSHNGIVSPAYHVYRPRPVMLPDYVNALVRISAFAKEASRWSKGVWSSRLRLYPQEMFQILFPVPPLEEQRKISERIRKQDEKMAELIRESELAITLLQERRSALISAAVTGKIDVGGEHNGVQ